MKEELNGRSEVEGLFSGTFAGTHWEKVWRSLINRLCAIHFEDIQGGLTTRRDTALANCKDSSVSSRFFRFFRFLTAVLAHYCRSEKSSSPDGEFMRAVDYDESPAIWLFLVILIEIRNRGTAIGARIASQDNFRERNFQCYSGVPWILYVNYCITIVRNEEEGGMMGILFWRERLWRVGKIAFTTILAISNSDSDKRAALAILALELPKQKLLKQSKFFTQRNVILFLVEKCSYVWPQKFFL